MEPLDLPDNPELLEENEITEEGEIIQEEEVIRGGKAVEGGENIKAKNKNKKEGIIKTGVICGVNADGFMVFTNNGDLLKIKNEFICDGKIVKDWEEMLDLLVPFTTMEILKWDLCKENVSRSYQKSIGNITELSIQRPVNVIRKIMLCKNSTPTNITVASTLENKFLDIKMNFCSDLSRQENYEGKMVYVYVVEVPEEYLQHIDSKLFLPCAYIDQYDRKKFSKVGAKKFIIVKIKNALCDKILLKEDRDEDWNKIAGIIEALNAFEYAKLKFSKDIANFNSPMSRMEILDTTFFLNAPKVSFDVIYEKPAIDIAEEQKCLFSSGSSVYINLKSKKSVAGIVKQISLSEEKTVINVQCNLNDLLNSFKIKRAKLFDLQGKASVYIKSAAKVEFTNQLPKKIFDKSLTMFQKEAFKTKEITKALLGFDISPNEFKNDVPKRNFEGNDEQWNVIKSVLMGEYLVYILEAPGGCGKTQICVELLLNLTKIENKNPVLFTAKSNAPLLEVAQRFNSSDLDILIIPSQSLMLNKNKDIVDILKKSGFYAHLDIASKNKSIQPAEKEMYKMAMNQLISSDDKNDLSKEDIMCDRIEDNKCLDALKHILDLHKPKLIIATTSMVSKFLPSLSHYIKFLIVDEGGLLYQSSLVSITAELKNLNTLFVTGDSLQSDSFPPVGLPKFIKKYGYQSVLDIFKNRSKNKGIRLHQLKKTYRYDHELGVSISEICYKNQLQPQTLKGSLDIITPIIGKKCENRIVWINCTGPEKKKFPTSRTNDEHTFMAVQTGKILRGIYPQKKITIGCYYAYQQQTILDALNNLNIETINVKTVAAYQGSESDIFILVLSISKKMTDYVDDIKRFRVACTRGKNCLILIGNDSVMNKSPKPRNSSKNEEEVKKNVHSPWKNLINKSTKVDVSYCLNRWETSSFTKDVKNALNYQIQSIFNSKKNIFEAQSKDIARDVENFQKNNIKKSENNYKSQNDKVNKKPVVDKYIRRIAIIRSEIEQTKNWIAELRKQEMICKKENFLDIETEKITLSINKLNSACENLIEEISNESIIKQTMNHISLNVSVGYVHERISQATDLDLAKIEFLKEFHLKDVEKSFKIYQHNLPQAEEIHKKITETQNKFEDRIESINISSKKVMNSLQLQINKILPILTKFGDEFSATNEVSHLEQIRENYFTDVEKILETIHGLEIFNDEKQMLEVRKVKGAIKSKIETVIQNFVEKLEICKNVYEMEIAIDRIEFTKKNIFGKYESGQIIPLMEAKEDLFVLGEIIKNLNPNSNESDSIFERSNLLITEIQQFITLFKQDILTKENFIPLYNSLEEKIKNMDIIFFTDNDCLNNQILKNEKFIEELCEFHKNVKNLKEKVKQPQNLLGNFNISLKLEKESIETALQKKFHMVLLNLIKTDQKMLHYTRENCKNFEVVIEQFDNHSVELFDILENIPNTTESDESEKNLLSIIQVVKMLLDVIKRFQNAKYSEVVNADKLSSSLFDDSLIIDTNMYISTPLSPASLNSDDSLDTLQAVNHFFPSILDNELTEENADATDKSDKNEEVVLNSNDSVDKFQADTQAFPSLNFNELRTEDITEEEFIIVNENSDSNNTIIVNALNNCEDGNNAIINGSKRKRNTSPVKSNCDSHEDPLPKRRRAQRKDPLPQRRSAPPPREDSLPQRKRAPPERFTYK